MFRSLPSFSLKPQVPLCWSVIVSHLFVSRGPGFSSQGPTTMIWLFLLYQILWSQCYYKHSLWMNQLVSNKWLNTHVCVIASLAYTVLHSEFMADTAWQDIGGRGETARYLTTSCSGTLLFFGPGDTQASHNIRQILSQQASHHQIPLRCSTPMSMPTASFVLTFFRTDENPEWMSV